MSSFADALARFHELIVGAAREGFANIEAEGLGAGLREATDALLEVMPSKDEVRPELEHLRAGLDAFEARGRVDRSRIVGHALRVSATLRARKAEAQGKLTRKKKESLGRGATRSRRRQPAAAPTPNAAAPVRTLPEGARGDRPDVLKGIGPKMAERLAARGLRCVEDLVYLLPLGYQDRRAIKPLDEVEEGEEALVEGVVRSFRSSWFRRRFNAKMVVAVLDPEGEPGEEIEARWFHPVGGLNERTKSGAKVLLAGPVKTYRGKRSMVHPLVIDPDAGPPGIAMRYPQVEGVGAATLARACRGALAHLDAAGAFEEALPAGLLAQHELIGQREALFSLHEPDPDIEPAAMRALAERRSPAHKRLAFEEFFFLQLALLGNRQAWTQAGAAFTGIEPLEREFLRACLPFEPTGAQWRVIDEIAGEMGSDKPMLRLVQGDVGSGKTVVAFAAALAVARAGGQVALMAPTEILAGQHMRTLEAWCKKAGMRVALLTGSTPRAQRNSILALLAGGQLDLLIGTHALIVGDVNFARLALVVVDEQHRFGVEQRAALRDKGGHPHLMVMTATPIPRSLALTAFGELEGSVIDELPPGRQPADTQLFTGKRGLAKARQLVVGAVEGGARAFVVCPLVEASEAVEASDVEATAQIMGELLDDPQAVSVVHGRMKSADKESAMAAFRAGDTRVLVATTVIEVGVDVPEATVMLVEHAERFGLAQLHQLRGRVGRGQGASSCFLHTASGRDSEAGRRLRVMEEHSDGFLVAEKDLEIRGPGEVFGTRQSGVPKLRFASFSAEGLLLLEAARKAARELRDADPELEGHARLREELAARIARGAVFAAESG